MISLVLPCYNEEESLPKALKRIPLEIEEIIISVDKKTTDQTVSVAKKFGLKVICKNTDGYGATILAGIRNASGDIIVTADGDATYPLEEIPLVVKYLKENKLDFVSCARFPLINSKSMKQVNYLGNKIVTFVINLLWNVKLKDGLSGMWVFKKNTFEKMKIISDNWNLSEEIKIEAISSPKIKFGEFHINYREREGKSKLPRLKVGIENILFLFQKKFLQVIKKS